jgi:hypothetical protein
MGLLDDFGEYLRRSGRNLGMGADAALANATANNARARDSAEATLLQMRGADLDPDQRDALHNPPYGGFGTDAGAPGGGLLGTFAGLKSATANRQMLGKAKAAISRGMDAETARQKFGWFQDPTGDWKYEISDHRAQLRTDAPTKSGYALEHPELRRAYPDLLDTLKVEEMPTYDMLGQPNKTVAEYWPGMNVARLNLAETPDREGALKALMHEVQHAVQDHEGHSPGTAQHSNEIGHLINTEYWPRYEQIENDIAVTRRFRENVINRNPGMTLEEFNKLHPDWAGKHDDLLEERRTLPNVSGYAFEKYNSALGEVEARDTMNRLRLTPEQRKAAPPYRGEGIPQDRIWDVRAVTRQLPRAADEPQNFQGLLNRTLGASPETQGALLSLLGIPFLPGDAQ